MLIEKFEKYDKETVKLLSDHARELTAKAPPSEKKVLSPAEVRMMLFRGTPFWVGSINGEVLTLNATKFGKKKTNGWEPYANWYIAFTKPEARRHGFAQELALHVRHLAIEAGCVRMKALAGTHLGYELHRSMGDLFWGLTPNGEIAVDTPLVSQEELAARGRQPFSLDTVPMSVRKYRIAPVPMSKEELDMTLMNPLRYDPPNEKWYMMNNKYFTEMAE